MKKLILFVVSLALLAALRVESGTLPERLRVLSVDLESALIGTPGLPGGEVAQSLRTLLEKADPDVLCLQGVLDWETCDRICKLKPGLRVLTCSAFESKNQNAVAPQVAILARDRAVISWVEEASDGSGFAFAVLQAGLRKLGVFSLQTPKTPAPSVAATDRLLAEIAKLQKFPQNRPDAFLVAGAPLTKSSSVIEANLQTIGADPQGIVPPGPSEFWGSNAGVIARPRSVSIEKIQTPALVCDFDAGSTFSSKFAYQTPLLFAGETPASLQAVVAPVAVASPAQARSLVWPVSLGAALVLILVLFFWRRSEQPSQLVRLDSPTGTLMRAYPVQQEAIRANLLTWLKSLFVQRLLSERRDLLAHEAEATRRTLLIEEKLSNLQSTLQTRISAYEARIERLEVELAAAAVENRDLIRAQIDLLKDKVAKAKEAAAFRRN